MDKQIIYELLRDNLCIQDKALQKLVWALYNNFYNDGVNQNILLIGDRGTGKTTMFKEAADLMDIPFGEVHNAFSFDSINMKLLANGLVQLGVNSDNYEGIILLHDFQDAFIRGHSLEFNAMVASNILNLDDFGYFNTSNICFVGEIDTDNVRDIFGNDLILSDLDTNSFNSPTLSIIQSYLTNANRVVENEDGSRRANVGFEKYVSDVIKNRFLASTTLDVFKQRIYMEDMGTEEIVKALNSPISTLNLYKDELLDDYMISDEFMRRVAGYILESGEGLHAINAAIENTFMSDLKSDKKVLKKGSLFMSRIK